MDMFASLVKSYFSATFRSSGGQMVTSGKSRSDTGCVLMVVAIGDFDQSEKEDCISHAANPKPKAIIKVQNAFVTLDLQEEI